MSFSTCNLFYRHKYLVYNMFCSLFASVLERQTGTTQNRMIDYRVGSSPITRTKKTLWRSIPLREFFYEKLGIYLSVKGGFFYG